MQHIVFINDSLPAGKLLIGLLKEFESLKKRDNAVKFFTEMEMEEMEDSVFLKMMETDKESGIADNKKIFKKLNIK